MQYYTRLDYTSRYYIIMFYTILQYTTPYYNILYYTIGYYTKHFAGAAGLTISFMHETTESYQGLNEGGLFYCMKNSVVDMAP